MLIWNALYKQQIIGFIYCKIQNWVNIINRKIYLIFVFSVISVVRLFKIKCYLSIVLMDDSIYNYIVMGAWICCKWMQIVHYYNAIGGKYFPHFLNCKIIYLYLNESDWRSITREFHCIIKICLKVTVSVYEAVIHVWKMDWQF